MTGSWIKEEKWLKINICIDFFLEIYPGYVHCLEFQDSISFCKIPTFFMHKMQFNTFSCCTVFLHFEMWSKHKKYFWRFGTLFLRQPTFRSRLYLCTRSKLHSWFDYFNYFFNNNCSCENLVVTHIGLKVKLLSFESKGNMYKWTKCISKQSLFYM